jgi:drug/metabolite transporter (DMT)-like permease
MTGAELTILYALGANLFFSSASILFADYSRKVSSLWMNAFKASIAFIFFLISVPLFSGFNPIEFSSLGLLLLSGLLGLTIGDFFLFKAYASIGAGRTLMLYGFEPIMLGSVGFLVFSQTLDLYRFWGILFFMLCLLIFSLEARKTRGSWEIKGLLCALTGVFFDACGIVLTRLAFDQSPAISSFEANLYRFSGAVLGFIFIARFIRPIHLVRDFLKWAPSRRAMLVIASLCGTYVSLLLYLRAVQTGHLATISGIAITSPLFATLLECFIQRKWPSKYLWAALAAFACGFFIVLEA